MGVGGPPIAQHMLEVANIPALPRGFLPKKTVTCDGNLRETSQLFQDVNTVAVALN